jgi:Na+-transporting methylmalonyl-CoA/oxaloacetate decarboxylase gamma subunit
LNNIFINDYTKFDMLNVKLSAAGINITNAAAPESSDGASSPSYSPDNEVWNDENIDGAVTEPASEGELELVLTKKAVTVQNTQTTQSVQDNDTAAVPGAVTTTQIAAPQDDSQSFAAIASDPQPITEDFTAEDEILLGIAEQGVINEEGNDIITSDGENGILSTLNKEARDIGGEYTGAKGVAETSAESETTSSTGRVEIEPDAPYTAAVVLTGFSVVFAVLILLILLMKALGAVFAPKEEKAVTEKVTPVKEPKVKEPKKAPVAVSKSVTPIAVSNSAPVTEDEDEIIAVIAAAIACVYEGTNTQYKIAQITPVRQRPQWALAGLKNNTSPF